MPIKSLLIKALRFIGIFLGALLSFVLLASMWLWFFPGYFIHEANLKRYIFPSLAQKGIQISSDDIQLEANSHSFWEKGLVFTSKNLCVKFQEEGENCFSEVKLKVKVNLSGFSLKEIELIEVAVIGSKLRLRLDDTDEEKKAEPFNWASLTQNLKLGVIHIDIPKYILEIGSDRFSGHILIKNPTTGIFNFDFKAASRKKTVFEQVTLQASREPIKKLMDLLDIQKANLEARLLGHKTLQLNASRERAESGLKYTLKSTYKSPPVRGELISEIHLVEKDLRGILNGDIYLKQIPSPLQIRSCQFQATLPDNQEQEGLAFVKSGSFSCKFNVLSKNLIKDRRYLKSLPQKIEFLVTANLETQKNSGDKEELWGKIKLELSPVITPMLEGHLVANYDINFSREDESSRIDFDPILLNGDLTVKDFYTLARLLNSLNILIPSPINVLKGTVKIKGSGEVSPRPLKGVIEVEVSSDLASKTQFLDMNAIGKLNFQACDPPQDSTFVHVSLLSIRTRLRLPNIDFKDPPVFLPDSRFNLQSGKTKKEQDGCPLHYKFDFQNMKEPIYIVSDILKKDLPLDIIVNAQSNKDLEGEIKILNYSTKLFERNATVEHFLLNLKSKELSGRIRVDYSDYKIFVILSGNTQSVQINLESDPPLSREQAFSVLLFGKTLDGLEPDETGSVRNADAAAKDGALTLASLYIFASTPIESVGYNPHTNGLVTKIKLSNGTTLNIGANAQGLTDASLTRRLSKHWRIQTTVQEPQEENRNRSASTLLEWFHRF